METHRFILVICLCLGFTWINASVIEKRDRQTKIEPIPKISREVIELQDEAEDEVLTCNAPPKVQCGYYNGTNYRMGSLLTLHCNQGCKLIGSPEIRCMPVPDPFHHVVIWDTFSGRLPTCQRTARRSAKHHPFYKTAQSDPEEEEESEVIPSSPPSLSPGPSIESMSVNIKIEEEGEIMCLKKMKKDGNEICCQPMKQGKCKAMFKKFYFDSSQSKCIPFVYGGCGGNDNRFSSLEECEDACLSSPKSKRKML